MSITDGKAFGITVGLDLAICLLIIFFFGLFRRSRVAYKFYSPARCACRERLCSQCGQKPSTTILHLVERM